jgi:hypothetical protein
VPAPPTTPARRVPDHGRAEPIGSWHTDAGVWSGLHTGGFDVGGHSGGFIHGSFGI